MNIKDKIESLRRLAYTSVVAQVSHGSITLQEGAFFLEEDFDAELQELVNKWKTENCYEF